MTQDEIIKMARKAGLSVKDPEWGYTNDHHVAGWVTDLEAFAKLVAAKELANHCEDSLNMVKQEQCTGCEGKPSNTNNPCAVCGKTKQEQGEPVAWVDKYGVLFDRNDGKRTPLYTTPQHRTWVGLTVDEVDEAARYCVKSGQSVNAAIRAIEAKLKEKNT
jgi:hypothetical protein